MAGFGETWELDEKGDLIFDASTQGFRTISGVPTLAQDVLYRLRSVSREDPINPQLGLPIVDMVANGYNPPLIEGEIRSQLAFEKRLASVDQVTVGPLDRNRQTKVTVKCTSIDGDTFSVSVMVNAP